MAWHPLTEDGWQRLLEAFRCDPSVRAAAAAAGCEWATAKAAYEKGHRKLGKKPIREILAQEQTIRRALVSEKLETVEAEQAAARLSLETQAAEMRAQLEAAKGEIEKLRRDVSELSVSAVQDAQRAHTALMVAGGVDAARDLEREAILVRMLQTFAISAIRVRQQLIESGAVENLVRIVTEDGLRKDLPPKDARYVLGFIVRDLKTVGEVATLSQDATRKYLGAPTQITEIRETVSLDPADRERMRLEFERINRQLDEYTKPVAGDVEDAVLEGEARPELPAAGDEAQAVENASGVQCPDVCNDRTDVEHTPKGPC